MICRAARTVVILAPAALLLVALPGCGGSLHAASRSSDIAPDTDPKDDHKGWLHTRTGVSLVDVIQIDGEFYHPSYDVVPTLGIGCSWRVEGFDFGAIIEHLPGGTSHRQDGTSVHLGDQALIAGSLRWRFVDRPWGGFYMLFNPGLGIYDTTESLRDAITERQASAPRDIASTGVGFSYSTQLGFFAVLVDGLVLQMDVATAGTYGTVTVDGDSQVYQRYRGLVRAGLEWRL